MKFVRYQVAQEPARLGIWSRESVIDLEKSYQRYRRDQARPVPALGRLWKQASLRALIQCQEVLAPFLTRLRCDDEDIVVRLRRTPRVRLCAPLHDPGRFIGVGLNYRDHAEEIGQPIPTFPPLFAKWANSIVGPGTPIVRPIGCQALDYEAELGVVMGRRADRVSVESAIQYVFGYTVINDISARDWQFRTSQWLAGKVSDGFAPMGPCVVESHDISDPQNLAIETYVNDKLRQNGHTRNMIFGVAQLISLLSEIVPLEPGDVIATGTPSGVGMSCRPPQYLFPNDVVRIVIDEVGVLENTVADPHSI